MTRTLANQATPVALAALLTAGMLLATSALASHSYRVAAAQEHSTAVAMDAQRVTLAGHLSAHA